MPHVSIDNKNITIKHKINDYDFDLVGVIVEKDDAYQILLTDRVSCSSKEYRLYIRKPDNYSSSFDLSSEIDKEVIRSFGPKGKILDSGIARYVLIVLCLAAIKIAHEFLKK